MSDTATLVERLNEISIKACACIPTDYYIHEKADATFTEVAEVTSEAAARIAELEAGATNYERLLREQAAEISRPFLARIAELEAERDTKSRAAVLAEREAIEAIVFEANYWETDDLIAAIRARPAP